MLMRSSMGRQDWCRRQMARLNESVAAAMREDVDEQVIKSLPAWHVTREKEYPWVLENCPPRGPLLDIGHDLRFLCGIVEMGVTPIVAHSVFFDVVAIGRVFPWLEGYNGGLRLEKWYSRHRHDITHVVGLLQDLDYIRDESFETIYCLSVIEHVLPDDLAPLMEGMWRLLKPGGRLALTCDWFQDWPVGDGIEQKVINYDLGQFFDRWGVEPEQNRELPWSSRSSICWDDPDILRIRWGADVLAVYGVTVTKPRG